MRRLAVSWIVTAAVLAAAQPRRKTSPIAPQFAAPFVSPVRVGLRTGGMRRYVSLPRVLPPLASQGIWAARGVFLQSLQNGSIAQLLQITLFNPGSTTCADRADAGRIHGRGARRVQHCAHNSLEVGVTPAADCGVGAV